MQQRSFFKIVFIIIAYVCNPGIAESQFVLDINHNSPIAGHTICKQKIQSTLALSNKIIDLTKVEVSSEKQDVIYFKEFSDRNNSAMLSCLDGGKLKKFSLIGDTLYLQAIENNQSKVLYGEKGFPYMFAFGAEGKLSFCCAEKHQYVDKITYDGDGRGIMTIQDGFKIVTPEADTLTEVVDLRAEIIVAHYINNQKIENVKQAHRYFAKGYRYPIVEVLCEKLGDDEFYEAYYYPKDAMESLSDDWDNRILRDELYRNDNMPKQEKASFYYELGRYDKSKGIAVKCKSQEDSKVRFVLTTLGGIVIYAKSEICSKNTDCSFMLTVPRLGSGTYVLYLHNNNKVMSETFNVR